MMLACEPSGRAVTLKMIEVAARAADRAVCLDRLGGDVLGRGRLRRGGRFRIFAGTNDGDHVQSVSRTVRLRIRR